MLLTSHQGTAQSTGLFGNDTNTVYLRHNIDRDRMALARIDISVDGSSFKRTALAERDDGELDSFILNDAKTQALLAWNVAGRSELELLDLTSKNRRRLPVAPAELVGSADFSPDGKRVVLTLTGSAAPADLWQLDLASGQHTRLTFSSTLGVDLAAPMHRRGA